MKKFLCIPLLLLATAFFAFAQDDEKKKEADKEKETKLPLVTESVTVEAKVPKDLPYAFTSVLKTDLLDPIKPKTLSDVLNFTSGTYVSVGTKNEWGVKIRGLGTNRITLLYDGIPLYEPYYNSFDLKAVPADQIDQIKVVKGASSVLYGPNALGGIVDVITLRPASSQFSLAMDYGDLRTYGIYGSAAWRGKNLLLTASGFREGSDGFSYSSDGSKLNRANSDYDRTSYGGKFYYYPGKGIELMAEVNQYQSEYGIPTTTTSFNKSQYWRFKDWQRFMANLGGSFPLFENGYLKARLYYTKHYNVLDAYKNAKFDARQWESTYDNYALGAFVLGMVPLGAKHELHASLNYRDDDVSTQSDTNKPWEKYNHKTWSLGLEEHFRISPKVKLMAGASLDHLNKQDGASKTTLNPILGVKFNPSDPFDLHLTLSQKSRFPSMKNLYSAPENGGNPDLQDEKGTNVELGFTYDKRITISGAIFYNRIKDMIDRRMGTDNLFRYVNVAKARIQGFELEVRKSIGPVSLSANYTYLDTENLDTGNRLDLLPASQLNLGLRFFKPKLFAFTLWAVSASDSIAIGSKETITVPPYTVVNATIEHDIGKVSIYFKAENLLDAEYAPEPGFPMRSRTLSAGFRFHEGK